MKVHVQVQSRADTGLVGKLIYRVKGPYIIMKDLGNNSFEVQRYGEEGSATRKYKNTELYLLQPALFPSETLDTMDQGYLDCNNSPIVAPLLKPMIIELYNNKWLQPEENALNPNISIRTFLLVNWIQLPFNLTLAIISLQLRNLMESHLLPQRYANHLIHPSYHQPHAHFILNF